MKKKNYVILALLLTLSFSRKKKSTTLTEEPTPPPTEAYCIYQGSDKSKVLLNCVKTSKEAVDMCKKYRDEGKVNVYSVKANDCDHC